MSPRSTHCAVPGEHDPHDGVLSSSAVVVAQVVAQSAPSSTASGAEHQPDNGGTPSPVPLNRRRRKGKPLSSGWKSLAWTKPPTEALHATKSVSSLAQRQPAAETWAAAPGANPGTSSNENNVAPVNAGSTPARTVTASAADNKNGTPEHQPTPPQEPTRRILRDEYLAGIVQLSSASGGLRSSLPRNFQRPGVAAELMKSSVGRQVIQPSRSTSSAEFNSSPRQSRDANAMPEFLQPQQGFAPMDPGQPQRGSDPQHRDAPALDRISQSLPNQHRRDSSIDADEANGVQVERSLSDNSIMTASDLGPKKTSNDNHPTILTEMTDEDAIAALVASIGKGRGLQVMKHAAASGGGKSRKFLKFNEDQGWLGLSGMLRPYFKTKICVRDIDKVDAKWCCVVVHSKGRSPVSPPPV